MNNIGKKIPVVIGAGLALSFISLNANASDNDSLAYMHESWAGIYVGAHFGSGGGDLATSTKNTSQNEQITLLDPVTSATSNQNSISSGHLEGDTSGSIADLFIGYNFHLSSLSNFIFGGQLEGTFYSDITLYSGGTLYGNSFIVQSNNSGGIVSSSSSSFNNTQEYTDELRSMFTFLSRVGYLIQPNLLIYMLGGGVEGNFVLPSDENFAFGDQRDKWQLGYTVGGGLEYRINDNWSLRGEYRFLHFNIDRKRSDFDNAIQAATTITIFNDSFSQSFNSDFDFNMGKIGVVYRFDGPRMLK